MNFLFIYETPGLMGGLETLIARMSNWLTRHGHSVTLLVKNVEGWGYTIAEEVNCIALGPRFRHLRYYYNAKKILREFSIPKPDVIKSFDLKSSWIACQIAALEGKQPKVVAGMYNPHTFEYINDNGNLRVWDQGRIILNNFFCRIFRLTPACFVIGERFGSFKTFMVKTKTAGSGPFQLTRHTSYPLVAGQNGAR